MEILLTGFTAFLTQEWNETAFPDDHVLTTHAKGEALLDTRIKTVMLESKQLLANAAEELCFHYAKTSKLQVKVFRLPYLYAVSASGAEQFARLFEQISSGTVQMDEQAAQPLLALCAE